MTTRVRPPFSKAEDTQLLAFMQGSKLPDLQSKVNKPIKGKKKVRFLDRFLQLKSHIPVPAPKHFPPLLIQRGKDFVFDPFSGAEQGVNGAEDNTIHTLLSPPG